MATHLSGQQWQGLAKLWSEVNARSGESLEGAWEHANAKLVELVGGKSMAGYACRRPGYDDGVEPVFFSAAGCDLNERMRIVSKWMAEDPEIESDPVNRQIYSPTTRCRAVPHVASVTPEQWARSASKRLADALGIGDAITVTVPAHQSAELFLCIDAPVEGRRFDYSDAAVLAAAAEGLRPLMLRFLRSLGLLPGQEPLSAQERELVATLAGEGDEAHIAAELGVSEPELAAMGAEVYRKLDVANRYGLIRLWFGVGEAPITSEVQDFDLTPPALGEPGDHELLLRRVRRQLTDVLGTPKMQLGDVARDLGMGERNLQRCLNEAGTSFRDLVDEVRELRARQLLSGTGLELTDIAFRLGYEHVSSFNRAFKRWTGKTPGELREEDGEAAGE